MKYEELIEAYVNTNYIVDGVDKPISIGETNEEINKLLKDKVAESWAFITAHNPMSEQYTNQQNIELNRQLEEDLSSYYCRMGVGKSRSGDWQERTVFLSLVSLWLMQKD